MYLQQDNTAVVTIVVTSQTGCTMHCIQGEELMIPKEGLFIVQWPLSYNQCFLMITTKTHLYLCQQATFVIAIEHCATA